MNDKEIIDNIKKWMPVLFSKVSYILQMYKIPYKQITEDISQEIYIAGYKLLKRYKEDKGKVSTYLLQYVPKIVPRQILTTYTPSLIRIPTYKLNKKFQKETEHFFFNYKSTDVRNENSSDLDETNIDIVDENNYQDILSEDIDKDWKVRKVISLLTDNSHPVNSLRRVSLKSKNMFTDRFLKGMRFDDIAKKYNVSRQNAFSRIETVTYNLKKEVQKRWMDWID